MLAKEEEVERLVSMKVLQDVSMEEVESDEHTFLSTRMVLDWRIREQKWKRRARLVAREFKSDDPTRPGLFSPAVGTNLARLIPTLATLQRKSVYIVDVKDAFLMVEQPDNIVIQLPPGRDGQPGKYYKLGRLIPGQRAGAALWCEKATGILQECDQKVFEQCPNVFTGNGIYIAMHVDDFVMAGPDDKILELLAAMGATLTLQVDGPYNQEGQTFSFLKKRYEICKDGVIVSPSPSQIAKLIEATKALTSVRPRQHRCANEQSSAYRSIVGRLLYVFPEIHLGQFAICHLASQMSRPTRKALRALAHFAGYLMQTDGHGVLIKRNPSNHSVLYDGEPHEGAMDEEDPIIEAFSDADWAGNHEDRCSVTCGYICIAGNTLFSFTRKQKSVALSSCESEFYAMSAVASEGVLIRDAVSFLTGRQARLVVRCDSSSAQALTNKRGVGRTRHLAARTLWLQSLFREEYAELRRVPTSLNIADAGTKPHSERRLKVLAALIGCGSSA